MTQRKENWGQEPWEIQKMLQRNPGDKQQDGGPCVPSPYLGHGLGHQLRLLVVLRHDDHHQGVFDGGFPHRPPCDAGRLHLREPQNNQSCEGVVLQCHHYHVIMIIINSSKVFPHLIRGGT